MNFDLYDFIKENASMSSIPSECVSVIEGATYDTYKAVARTNMKAIKQAYRDAKKYHRDGDKAKALAKAKECKEGYQALRKELYDIDDTFMGDVCGMLLAGGIFSMFFDIKVGGGAEYAKTALLDLVTMPITSILGRCIKLTINQDKGVDTSNLAKSDIIAALDENIKMCDKLIDAIKKS